MRFLHYFFSKLKVYTQINLKHYLLFRFIYWLASLYYYMFEKKRDAIFSFRR